MRLATIVTDFPKITETFILRELVELHRRGHEVRVYHLTRFRRHEVVHEFARPALQWARYEPFLCSAAVLRNTIGSLVLRPRIVARIVAELLQGLRRDPAWLAKSLAIVPKSIAFADELARWGADHVHAQFAGHPATCAWIVGRLTGIPYSVSCHANDIFRTQAMLATKLGEAAFVRSISEYNRRFLHERVPSLRAKPIAVIHIGLPVEQVEPLEPAGGSNFRVLYVGSLEPKKGVGILLKALHRAGAGLGDWSCEILGGGPEREALEALARELDLGARVRFRGPQPFEEVERAYADANVVVVPSVIGPASRAEGIPTVLVEALAHQRPVIASRMTGIPELVIDGETGALVEPGDVEALAAAVIGVRQHPDRARATAVNGRRRVVDQFDLGRTVAAQESLFRRFRRPPGEGS